MDYPALFCFKLLTLALYSPIGRRIDLHGASPHIFRHSYATMLNDAGVPIKTILGIIGHADLQTTANRYIHGREEKKQEAVLSVSRLLAI